MLSSRSFIVSDFIFRSLIHFELIFVCGVRVFWMCFRSGFDVCHPTDRQG